MLTSITGKHVADRLRPRRQRQELEDQALRAGRLPPGQSLTLKWPVLDTGAVPTIDTQNWRLRLFGLVDVERVLTWDDITSLPMTSVRSDIHCVTRWSKLDNEWEGVPARDVVADVRPNETARFVMVHAPGYSANLPLAALLEDDVLFAVRHQGVALPAEHGGPIRLVLPKRYFWKSVKWVDGLEFMAENRPGYWEERGYHSDGDPWREERFGGV